VKITALIKFPKTQKSTEEFCYAFYNPIKKLVAYHYKEVYEVLNAVEEAAKEGFWCIGYIRYEAAPAFDNSFKTYKSNDPLVWFSVHNHPKKWPLNILQKEQAKVQWSEHLKRNEFNRAITSIHKSIRLGDVYQVNYTAPFYGLLKGKSIELFGALLRAQPQSYAAYINSEHEEILSLSPELFFDWITEKNSGDILTRPMKGTIARGNTPEEDNSLIQKLRTNPKELSENLMIVDLLRNDLSRIAQIGSIEVPLLFHIQKFATVSQMSSDIIAKTKENIRLFDIFNALFPCGSITGAPKIRSMQIIHQLEKKPRGIYCGAIGLVHSNSKKNKIRAIFNVSIRTVIIQNKQCISHIGSGITSEAQSENEWQEWNIKRKFIERASQPFDIIEKLALLNGEFRNLKEHIERLAKTAKHFEYPCNLKSLQINLEKLKSTYKNGIWHIRIKLNRKGEVDIKTYILKKTKEPVQLKLAKAPFRQAQNNEFVDYKTTNRAHYRPFQSNQKNIFDTLLWNQSGQITETTFGNIAAFINNKWITPPLSSGLLPGIGRMLALREGKIIESILNIENITEVNKWAFINSSRGWLQAQVSK
jgi:para-aminobenzoate synthetase/4-amino-4-deoxychorismate lyase